MTQFMMSPHPVDYSSLEIGDFVRVSVYQKNNGRERMWFKIVEIRFDLIIAVLDSDPVVLDLYHGEKMSFKPYCIQNIRRYFDSSNKYEVIE